MGNAPRKRALMDDSGRSEDGSAGGPPSSKRSKTIDCNTKQDRYNYANDKEAIKLALSTPPIAIVVGHDRSKFSVVEGLLCYYSDFFRNALKGGFREADAKAIELPEHSPLAFRVFVQWMYTHPASHIWPHGVDDEDIDALTLCDLDDLAEYLQSGKFATYVKSMTSEFSEKFDANRDAKTVAAIYEKTTEERPARTIFVDRFVAFGSATETRSHGFNEFPPEFLYDIAVALLDRRDVLDTALKQYRDSEVPQLRKELEEKRKLASEQGAELKKLRMENNKNLQERNNYKNQLKQIQAKRAG